MRILVVLVMVGVQAGCGGGPAADTSKPAPKPAFETRWLRGIAATEVKNVAQLRGLACEGPRLESGTNVWACAARTPLVAYSVRFYGSAPLKIEYITATITQAGAAKPELVRPLFVALAGLHYDGGDAQQQRTWVMKAIEAPGQTTVGPGRFRVSGDLSRLTLDIKASASDW